MSTLNELLEIYRKKYDVLAEVNLDHWHELKFYQKNAWLMGIVTGLYRDSFADNQRLIFFLTQGEEYESDEHSAGVIIKSLQGILNKLDISNFFVIILMNDIDNEKNHIASANAHSLDPVPIVFDFFQDPPCPGNKKVAKSSKTLVYDYNSKMPIKILPESLTNRQRHLLLQSDVFCIYPWIHIHAYPNGETWPCCHADMQAGALGNCRQNTLEEIWNNDRMKNLRLKMLHGQPDKLCVRCYEQESAEFLSGRLSANKHHGHHIFRIDHTREDGHLEKFEMVYWDIRFSNLCNLSCRSCGHIFSSSWYQDQVKLAGPDWAKKNKPLQIAGRDPMDMWNQLLPHLDYVEQIYFAGGEPLMMEEHYHILEELERRNRFDVRLIYNTNFTQVKLKDRYVFDYWKKFKSVAVGASLDAMGSRAEYIRKGTDWAAIENNRRKMIDICPDVDFYISPTLSILNAWHLPDFHRQWVDQGLLRPQDLNVNILQDPAHLRLDIAPMKYKQHLSIKFEEHLAWLKPLDQLGRATQGFQSAINFMMSTDNTVLLQKFRDKTQQLDTIRNESLLDVIPELESLFDENSAS